MMYYVNWVLTTAQLELLATDVSVVDYNYKKEKKKRVKGEFDDTPASKSALREAAEEWKERFGEDEAGATGLSMQDILGAGANAGVGIKLKD